MKTIKITQQKCKQCGHVWFPRKPGTPIYCGRCKSARWNVTNPKK